jgi:hypothetical protein
MKKIIFLSLIVFLSSQNFAQFENLPPSCANLIDGGFGLNWIDGQPYYSIDLRPEFSLANWGLGLDLRFDIDANGNLRKEDFNELSDYLSIIRYLRYGEKGDPVYVKLGALDYYTLGHGSIMYNYNNSPSYDARKIGLVFDVDFGNFGFESIYSKFAEAGVTGIRGYVRPLKFTDIGDVPIIGSMEVGATYAGDFSQYAGIVSGYYNPATNEVIKTDDRGSLNIVGADIGFPIFAIDVAKLELYMDYAKIINFGSGVSTGALFTFSGLGLISGSVKLERRFNGAHYLPSYFNSLYEIERFEIDNTATSESPIQSKIQELASTTDPGNGYFGSLLINVLGAFNILGSYERLDKYPTSGIFHAYTEIAPEDVPFILNAGYDKTNIKNEKDLFTLDDRSYLYAELGYKPYPFLVVSMVYSWTFTPVRDANNNIIDYKPQKRIEPKVSLVFPFGCGG